jgi:hypothetical protein
MKLDEIYRDIYSRINNLQLEHPVFEMDIIKAINDACVSIRNEYLKVGRYQGFTVTEDVYFTVPDYYHPYLNSYTLNYAIAPELSAQEAVIAATAQLVNRNVPNIDVAVTLGKDYVKDGVIYTTVATSGAVNMTDLKFEGRVKSYVEENGLKYTAGDIIKDVDGGYWKIKQTFVNIGITLGNATYFEEMFLQAKQTNFVTPVIQSFERLNNLKLIADMENQVGISINENKLYATKNAKRVVLEYVPEWVEVTNREEEIPVTRLIANQVKQETLRLLEHKVGKQLTDNRLKQDAE